MTEMARSSLVGLAGNVKGAANENQVAEAVVSSSVPQSDEIAGWDPYEVWRTRVKTVRDTRSKTEESDGPL